MPIYEYACANGHHHDVIRRYEKRDEPWGCLDCGAPMTRREVSASHVPPDGLYSYAPNIGDPERHELRNEAIRTGQKVIERGNTRRERAEIERDADRANDRAYRNRY